MEKREWLAIGPMVWGRAETVEEAVKIAAREYRHVKRHLGNIFKTGETLRLAIYDHTPWDSVVWGDDGTWGYKGEDEGARIYPAEIVTATLSGKVENREPFTPAKP